MKLELSTTSFEDYLKDKHLESEPMLLDDDIPEAFDSWLEAQDQITINAHAQLYAHAQGKLLAEAYIKEQGIE